MLVKNLKYSIAFLSFMSNHNVQTNTGFEKATFAGGCFWCMEPPPEKLNGVISVTSGYTGGHKKNPSYEEVSSGNTGHLESIQIIYDPSKITYNELLDVGVVRELARGVLPVTIYTQFIFTCNLHSLFHFLKLRNHLGAQWEIRQYTYAMEGLADPYFPVSFEAWREHLKG